MRNGLVYLETNWIETSSGASGWSDQDFDHLKGSFWCEDACLHVESRGLLVGLFVGWLVGWFGWCHVKLQVFQCTPMVLEVTTNYRFCHIFLCGNYISISRNDKLFIYLHAFGSGSQILQINSLNWVKSGLGFLQVPNKVPVRENWSIT